MDMVSAANLSRGVAWLALAAVASSASAGAPIPVAGPVAAARRTPADIDAAIAEAAARFALPPAWIRAVIRAESGGIPYDRNGRPLVSRAGAIGLMQLMPETYAAMARAQRLGPDPSLPRDNILAGTAFLRAMYDRFGSPGFLAAYNAGPGRWADHVATGAPLPRETVAYLAAVGGRLGLARIDVKGGRDPTDFGVASGDDRAAGPPPDMLFPGGRSIGSSGTGSLFFSLRGSSDAAVDGSAAGARAASGSVEGKSAE